MSLPPFPSRFPPGFGLGKHKSHVRHRAILPSDASCQENVAGLVFYLRVLTVIRLTTLSAAGLEAPQPPETNRDYNNL